MTSELQDWPRTTPPFRQKSSPAKAVVFIHGILSDTFSFERMHERFCDDARFNGFEFLSYNYNYHEGLEKNGRKFAQALANRFSAEDSVAIVAHSMGGLVARLAILAQHLPFAHSLFLLGTPNSGAMRTSQLSLLAELMRRTAGQVSAIFPRKKGIMDLTRASEIMRHHQHKAKYAEHVDYVSIPGLYFYGDRSWLELADDASIGAFATLRIALSLLASWTPFTINLDVPHDGIVEERSNRMIPSTEGRINEKNDSINFPHKGPHTYAHVEVRSCRDLTHVHLQSDPQIFRAVASIILSTNAARHATPPTERRLERWRDRLRPNDEVVRVEFDR
jgi:pimeloyl-ACP methyl ester carboxylesterase